MNCTILNYGIPFCVTIKKKMGRRPVAKMVLKKQKRGKKVVFNLNLFIKVKYIYSSWTISLKLWDFCPLFQLLNLAVFHENLMLIQILHGSLQQDTPTRHAAMAAVSSKIQLTSSFDKQNLAEYINFPKPFILGLKILFLNKNLWSKYNQAPKY